jgi:hypothetical protein
MNVAEQTYSLAPPRKTWSLVVDALVLLASVWLAITFAPITFGLMSLFQGVSIAVDLGKVDFHPKLRMAIDRAPWVTLFTAIALFSTSLVVSAIAGTAAIAFVLTVVGAQRPEARFYEGRFEIIQPLFRSVQASYSDINTVSLALENTLQLELKSGRRLVPLHVDRDSAAHVAELLQERVRSAQSSSN